MIWLNEPIKFVKVSRIEDKGTYVKAQLSTSEKKQDGTREYSNWNTLFSSKCADLAKTLNDGDVITITKGKLTNVYNKEKKVSYCNMTVFEFTSNEKKDTSGINDDFSFGSVDDKDDVPWL